MILPTTPGGFRVIYADPPWDFSGNSVENPGRNARGHYECMSLDEITALEVADITAEDAICFFWITGPFLVVGAHIPIMRAWGFEPSAIGFVWAKLNKRTDGRFFTADDFFMGGGHTTRANAEYCLIGKKGKSLRKSRGVREMIVRPLMRHSEKPAETRRRIETYVGGQGPMLELFARHTVPGWHAAGNQVGILDGNAR